MNNHLHCVTAESVRRGHPDKFCDQLADRILDAYLKDDPDARVAVEVMISDGELVIAGEISAKKRLNTAPVVEQLISDIDYAPEDLGAEDKINVHINLNEQSPDIAQAVNKADASEIGAGDQGIVIGYATEETPEYMPLPVVLAHRICRELDTAHHHKEIAGLGADGKAQVTVLYNGTKPIGIAAVVVSFQHEADAQVSELNELVRERILQNVLPKELMRPRTRLLINPSGRFVKGGPSADTGLTGRKLAVDFYGPAAHIGGGALSGKDPTKTDRSGAYAARWVAKCIVAAGLAKQCEVQIAYAIGKVRPVSVDIDTFGTGILPDYVIEKAVSEVFDLRPAAIMEQLKLCRPIYSDLAAYGHFGRTDLNLPWEDTSKSRELVATAIRQNTAIEASVRAATRKAPLQ